MVQIRQFRPALYSLTILGITGFAIAAQSAGIWVLAVSAVALNYWLVSTGRFRPLPRLIANAITLLCVAVLAWLIRLGLTAPILLIGDFLVLLQLVKLYEQRANRDYAQLLVLGPLLMVAGAISTYSLIFGVLFFIYLVMALYCCLLFHLKVETDHARKVVGVQEESGNESALVEQERLLGRSLRRVNGAVAFIAIFVAVLTFLFFPRFTGVGLAGPYQWRPSMALSGFSESVNFQNVAMIAQNPEPVASVKAFRGDQPYQGTLLLRGLALDRYTGAGDNASGNAYQWNRSLRDSQSTWPNVLAGDTVTFGTQYQGMIYQEITLLPTGTSVVFAIGGIASFTPRENGRFRYTPADEVLQTADPMLQRMEYTVMSRDRLIADPQLMTAPRTNSQRQYLNSIDPQILAFAQRPEVCGSDEQGPLAARRPRESRVTDLDTRIAQNIETYLKDNFTYTLDLTDAARIAGRDPLVAFLYDFKRGHCEYFAGAMTLMCQSLGMQARMIVGFKCDEYNPIGNFYTVRQRHAHAWVEVLSSQGDWVTFDPTTGRDANTAQVQTFWQRARSLFSYLEYTWANSVIAYDPSSTTAMVQDVDRRIGQQAEQSNQALTSTMNWLSEQRARIFSQVLGWLVVLVMAVLFLAIGWFIFEKWKLHRRAARIGLDALPSADRLQLAKKLAFYDDLMKILERHRLRRPAHLTPLEFSQSLTFLPVDVYGLMRTLTEAFYEIRYGRAELDETRKRSLYDGVARVESSFERQSS